MHATVAPMLLPYDPIFDDKDWWSSQAIIIELMVASMPEHIVQFNHIYFMNGFHRPYVRNPEVCVKPPDGGMSLVAEYLQPRVSKCMRDQIGKFVVGSSIKCHECETTCACEHSADCKPVGGCRTNASEPINYADVVKCKPSYKMGKGPFVSKQPPRPPSFPTAEVPGIPGNT
jgi:hypothetical protein